MKYISSLSPAEIITLKEAVKHHSKFSVRMRAHSILMNHQKLKIKQISSIYEVTRQTVSSWLESWATLGISSLFHSPKSGGPSKNTKLEKEKIQKNLQETPHSPKHALSKISQIMKNSISRTTLKRIAKSAGLSWKRVRKSLKKKRDEKEFRICKDEIQQLRLQEIAGEIDLFYFDESGFSLTPVVPYAWQPIGEQLEVPSSRSCQLNVLGFLNIKNHLESFCFDCPITTDIVIECMNQFCKTLKKETVLILDNASIHRSKDFQDNIEEWKRKGLKLKFLSTYSPELNLIEVLWKHMKYYWLHFEAYSTYNNLVFHVENILKNVGSKYRIEFT